MKRKCDVDFTRLPPPPSYHQNVSGGGGGGGGEVNFGVVDNFPYPPFVTHSTLTSGKKEKSSTPSFLPVPVASVPSFPPALDLTSKFRKRSSVLCLAQFAATRARDWLI